MKLPVLLTTLVALTATFALAQDRLVARKHLVIVMAEDEYKTAESLPKFAKQHLKDFQVSLVFGNPKERNDIPGITRLNDADIALISVRRRVLPKEQMDAVRKFVADGKPVVGIRTASHAFSLRGKQPPEGLFAWESWDADINGGSYTNHYGNNLQAHFYKAKGAEHPILTGINDQEFPCGGSLYKSAPLGKKTTTLMMGRVEGQPPEPVAWTNTHTGGGRVFYTSLGHVKDFEQPAFQQLLRNGIYWAAGLDVPKE